VIPTFNGWGTLEATLTSLETQTISVDVVVVDNASTDGTSERLLERFPQVRIVRNDTNLGFGRAINRAALELEGDALVLVNNDVVCESDFVERICEPLSDPCVGMVAGVLLLASDPERIDTAGVELDTTLGSHDYLSGESADLLETHARGPFGACGGAAAYRLDAFKEVGGFDESFFAYWEDVDLAMRLRGVGWKSAFASSARGVHHHSATLGAASPRARELHAFGRGYVLAKYDVMTGVVPRLQVAALDYPAILVHLLVRRETAPLRARRRGQRSGAAAGPSGSVDRDAATVSFGTALARQWRFLSQRLTGRMPAHFNERSGKAEA